MLSSPARACPPPALPPPPAELDGRSLFFDLDGTLIEIASTPDGVVVQPSMLAGLRRLATQLPGRVALVSGRSLSQIDQLIGPVCDVLSLAGSHGAERRWPGVDAAQPLLPPALAQATRAMADYAERHGLVLERKTMGTALHYRQRPDLGEQATNFAADLAARHGLVLQRGKMMAEVRAAGDKGRAIAHLLQTPAMAGTSPLFFGDDVTDEDGFIAAAEAGGAGVLVGDARPTAALHRLGSVGALHAWIETALEGAA